MADLAQDRSCKIWSHVVASAALVGSEKSSCVTYRGWAHDTEEGLSSGHRYYIAGIHVLLRKVIRQSAV